MTDLLEAMVRHGVKNFIFSSSAAVYGEPEYTPIDEAHPLLPESHYALSKLAGEAIADQFARWTGMTIVSPGSSGIFCC